MSAGMSILLDNPSKHYFPGEVISGKVKVQSDQAENSRGLQITLTGSGEIIFYTGKDSEQEARQNSHQVNEKYCELCIFLLGDGQQDVKIPAGETFYPFSIQIPNNLPSTYFHQGHMNQFGKTVYVIEATDKRPWAFDITCEQPINIVGVVDLNNVPNSAQPGQWKNSKKFGCFCCPGSSLNISVKLNAQGYVPGETIFLEVEGNNLSRNQIERISVEIVEVTKLNAPDKCKVMQREVTDEYREGVEPRETFTWCPQLVVPTIPPTNLGGECKIISVDYFLKVIAHLGGVGNLEVCCPIIIGSVPLRK